MNFAVADNADRRFDGDFNVAAAAGYHATDVDQVFLNGITEALGRLAEGERRDAAGGYPPDLLKDRRAWRTRAAKDLRRLAEALASGQIAIEAATQRMRAVAEQYREVRPKFGTADALGPRFTGDFQIVRADDLANGEASFVTHLELMLDHLTDDETSDANAGYTTGVLAARKKLRGDHALKLRNLANKVAAGLTQGAAAAEEIPEMLGGYCALRDQITQTLFDVSIFKEKLGDREYNAGFDLEITAGLPPPNDAVSPDKQELYNDINSAFTVIRVVCQRMRDGGGGLFAREADEATKRRALQLHDEYTVKLAGVAAVGLKDSHTAFGKAVLAAIKNEFVAREAGRIKNSYVLALGICAAIAFLLFLLAWVLTVHSGDKEGWWYLHKSFLLAGAGSAIGTWVSFSVRRVELSFDQLMMSEEWSLDPPLRILFVVALTMAACLLFWTNVMNIEIGDLKTNAAMFKQEGSVALLIGLFAGLSERALATAVSGRAAAFVGGLGGKP